LQLEKIYFSWFGFIFQAQIGHEIVGIWGWGPSIIFYAILCFFFKGIGECVV
jgi:hypothetical protein